MFLIPVSVCIQWTLRHKFGIVIIFGVLLIALFYSTNQKSKANNENQSAKALLLQEKLKDNLNARLEENLRVLRGFERIEHSYDARMDEKIRIALKTYDADKIGMIDYALESRGGRIFVLPGTCEYVRVWSTLLWNSVGVAGNNRPETMLRPGNQPGECYAFAGSIGRFCIQLAAPIHITAVTIDHVPLATVKDTRSAPRDFVVYGRAKDNLSIVHKLGTFHYDINGFNSIQTFYISPTAEDNEDAGDHLYMQMELHIQSNYGHPSYTCVYRVRVHGNE